MSTLRKIFKTEAVILQHFPFGETDYILNMYTPNLGKIRAIVKGARRIKSKMGGHLEPLMRSSLALVKGHNLSIVHQAELVDGFRELRDNLNKLTTAMYVSELVDALTPEEQSSYQIYRLIIDTLKVLTICESRSILPYFQMRLLTIIGFMPELYQCVECGSKIVKGLHRFVPSHGGVLCNLCNPENAVILKLSISALKVLRFLQNTESVYSVQRLELGQGLVMELRRLIDALLENILVRDIRTQQLLGSEIYGITNDLAITSN